MKGWYGRTLIVVCALLAVYVARPVSSAEVPRSVLVRLVHVPVAPTSTLTVPAGSVENLADSADGLAVEGWIGRQVDEVDIEVDDAVTLASRNLLLAPRPDVGDLSGLIYSGFRAVFPGVRRAAVDCVALVGPSGAANAVFEGSRCPPD